MEEGKRSEVDLVDVRFRGSRDDEGREVCVCKDGG